MLHVWCWNTGGSAECSACMPQASLLGAERLEGDNQYFCGYCQAKVDARRQIRLGSLPPYLCLSLQRFVFDMKARPALSTLLVP